MQYTYSDNYGNQVRYAQHFNKTVDKDIVQNMKEEKLSFPKLLAKIRHETDARRVQEYREAQSFAERTQRRDSCISIVVSEDEIIEKRNQDIPGGSIEVKRVVCLLAEYWRYFLGRDIAAARGDKS